MSDQQITFVPWVKQGLGANLKTTEGKPQSTIKVNVKAKAANGTVDDYEITKTVNLVEPGDILGLSKTAIKKTEPANWITNFESNYLPYVEFYDEDLPWRFTPVETNGDQLAPWLALVVLKEEEFTRKGFSGVLETIEVADPNHSDQSKVLPNLADQWAWAHVQYNGTLSNGITELQSAIETDPSQAVSRLLSSRRLEKDTGYYAFLVPGFERGRLAGLGKEVTGNHDAKAWDPLSSSPVELPFYHEWYFKTAQTGDFEDLARALRPRKIDPNTIGFREIDLQDPGNANLRKKAPSDTIELPGVIVPDVDESKVSAEDNKWPIPWNKGHIKYLDQEAPYFDLSQMKTVVKDERGQQRKLQYGRCYYMEGIGSESILQASTDLSKYRITNDAALSYNGDNSLSQLSNGCTYSAWIKFDGAISGPVVLFAAESHAQSPVKSIRMNAAGTKLQLRDSNNAVQTINWVPDTNVWYFVAVSIDFTSGAAHLYTQKQGQGFQATGTAQLSTTANTFCSLTGFGNFGNAHHFSGYVFDIRFYKSVLTQDEVESLARFNIVSPEKLYQHYWCAETMGQLVMDSGPHRLHLSLTTDDETQFHDNVENDFFSALDIFGYGTLSVAEAQYFSSGTFVDNGAGKLTYRQNGLDTAWYLDSALQGSSEIVNGAANIASSAANPSFTASLSDLSLRAGLRYRISFYYEKGTGADKAYLELNDGSTTYLSQDLSSDDGIKSVEFTLQDDGSLTGYLKIYASSAGAASFILDDLVVETLSITPAATSEKAANALNGLSLTHKGRAAFNAHIVNNPCITLGQEDFVKQTIGTVEPLGTNDFYFESLVYIPNDVNFSFCQFFNGYDANWRLRFDWGNNGKFKLYIKDFVTTAVTTYEGTNNVVTDYGGQWIQLGCLGIRSHNMYVTVNGVLYDTIDISGVRDIAFPAPSTFLKNRSTPNLEAAYVKFASFENGRYGYSNVAYLKWEAHGTHFIPFLEANMYNMIDGETITLSKLSSATTWGNSQNVYSHKALYGWASYSGGSVAQAPLALDGTALLIEAPNDNYTIHPGATRYLEVAEFGLDLAIGAICRNRTGLDSWTLSSTAPGTSDSVALYEGSKAHNLLIDSQSPANENFFQQELLKLLNQNAAYTESAQSQDPIITPPLYGRWHALKKQLDPTLLSQPDWFHQVNLSPIYRNFAGMGAEVVRRNQEYFMDILWQQADEVLEANRQINRVATSYEANESAKARSIDAKPDETFIIMTSSVHNRVKDGNESVYQVINQNSAIPGGLVSGMGRRITRKKGTLVRALSTSSTTLTIDTAVAGFNNHTCVAAPVYGGISGKKDFTALTTAEIAPGAVITLPPDRQNFFLTKPGTPFVSPSVSGGTDNSLSINWRPACDGFHIDFSAGANYTVTNLPSTINLGNLATEVASNLATKQNYLSYLNATVENKGAEGQAQSFTSFNTVMQAPKIDLPMYSYLYGLSPDAFLPNINQLPQNSVSIFKNQQDVIEAFFIGLNHEMNREMLWREYPTDQRATVFNKFWGGFIPPDVSTPAPGDYNALRAIKNIHNWKNGNGLSTLGENKPATAPTPHLILAIRGELLKKYPDTLMYMQKAKWAQTDFGSGDEDDYSKSREVDSTEAPKLPIFFARVADTMLFGFDVQETVAKGSEMQPPYQGPYTDPGYFFVFQEIASGMHFGMDYSPEEETAVPVPTTPPAIDIEKWSNLSWKYFKGDPIPFINPNYTDDQILASDELETDSSLFDWGEDGGQFASILYQNPILLSIHAKDLLR